MIKSDYEIIFIGDFREPSFRHTTIADQLKALVLAGYRAGFVQLAGDRAVPATRIHHDIRTLIENGRLAHLDPDQDFGSKLVIATDPSCFVHKPRMVLRIDAPLNIILVSDGPISMAGQEIYNWKVVYQNVHALLTGDVTWMPSNLTTRAQLDHLNPKPELGIADWPPSIDPHNWHIDRVGFCSTKPIIGQSGPPSGKAWPNSPVEILSLYPDDPQFLVRILNGGAILGNQIGSFPRNWEILTSDRVSEREFLSSIDFFVYGYHSDRCHPIDPSLLRAMASGAVAILPPAFEESFGDGAIYSEPHNIRANVQNVYGDRARYLSLSQAGQKIINQKYSNLALVDRVHQLIGGPDRHTGITANSIPTGQVGTTHGRRRVMFITINGVGMGHLTRMLAIAKRCSVSIEPVFVTMSQALKVLREQGYLAEFIPSRQYLNCDTGQWNSFLRDELNEMISFYDPAVVVFDGNVPYQGIVDVIQDNPDPWFIWSRRGMWRSNSQSIIDREKHFDAVLEPGDLASSDDYGITNRYTERTHYVPPIRLLDNNQLLSREEARAELGLEPDKTTVLIQLGARNNFDYRTIHNTSFAHLQNRSDVQVAFGEWLISDQPVDLPDEVARMPGYPFARYFNAFDVAISAVGYNSFHELLFAGVPTILVPNEAMEQDNQLVRALYADRQRLAVCVRTNEVYRLTATIDKLLDTDERARIQSALADLDQTNGASEAAALINELAYSRRVDKS